MDKEQAVELAAELARRFEQLRLRPYLCPAGIPTIGYGATYYEDGRLVTLSDPPLTRKRAEELLQWMIRARYMPAVIRLCPRIDREGRLAAIVDFAFNCGINALRASTLRKRVNADQWDDVPRQLRRWTQGGGKRLRGLALRREAEIALL